MARMKIFELGYVAICKCMAALVHVPSMRMSPASRKLALENAMIIWFEDGSNLSTFKHGYGTRCVTWPRGAPTTGYEQRD